MVALVAGGFLKLYLGKYLSFDSWIPKDYILRENASADKAALKDYERQFLTILFGGSIEFDLAMIQEYGA